jgi:hypothetical protein
VEARGMKKNWHLGYFDDSLFWGIKGVNPLNIFDQLPQSYTVQPGNVPFK